MLAALAACAFDHVSIAHYLAMGCGVAGATLGPVLLIGPVATWLRDGGSAGTDVASDIPARAIQKHGREQHIMQVVGRDDDIGGTMSVVITRRGMLLGLTGIGVAGVLTGCGKDKNKENPVVTGKGAEEVGNTPGIGNETGIGTGGGSGQGETEEAATPGS